MKRAAVLITAGDGTVIVLKMWDTNCTDSLLAGLFDDLCAETVNCCGSVRTNTGVVQRVFDRNETSRATTD
jgi:hypothetical protein